MGIFMLGRSLGVTSKWGDLPSRDPGFLGALHNFGGIIQDQLVTAQRGIDRCPNDLKGIPASCPKKTPAFNGRN